MKVYTINIGQVIISHERALYNCFGLGSCIGLFLHDRDLGLTGAAHILLPDAERGPDAHGWYCADDAIAELVRRFQQHGSTLTGLSAKMVGGANTLGTTATGARNVKSVTQHLRRRNIFIAATDVGGTQSRTAQFETTTGALTVRTAGDRTGTIF
jgi:chemotaxis protein CheD